MEELVSIFSEYRSLSPHLLCFSFVLSGCIFELCTWRAKWSKRMNEHSHWICTIKSPTIWLALGEKIARWGKNSDWRANGKWHVGTYLNHPPVPKKFWRLSMEIYSKQFKIYIKDRNKTSNNVLDFKHVWEVKGAIQIIRDTFWHFSDRPVDILFEKNAFCKTLNCDINYIERKYPLQPYLAFSRII